MNLAIVASRAVRRTWLVFGLLCGVLLPAQVLANDELEAVMASPRNWAAQTGDYSAQRNSRLRQINRQNAQYLKLAWSLSTGVVRGHEGAPLVIDGVMYLHTPFPNQVLAVSLDTQQILWKYVPRQDPAVIEQMCCDTGNGGLAYAQGRLFLQRADSTLEAIDARTGRVIWSVRHGDARLGAVSSNAPQVFRNLVVTGIAGGQWGVRGYLAAFDMHSGRPVWKAYSTGSDAEMLVDPLRTLTWVDGRMEPVGADSSLSSWRADQWRVGGGATTGTVSYDKALGLIFYGTGHPAPLNGAQRPGENRWTSAIMARDLETGVARWVYQTTPGGGWGYDATSEKILADLNVRNRPVKALVHFDGNGFAYTMDRESGALLVAERFESKANWASGIDKVSGRPVGRSAAAAAVAQLPARGVCPSIMGAKRHEPAAFEPVSRLFMVPTHHLCMDVETSKAEYVAGQPFLGLRARVYVAPSSHGGSGNFIAWDAAAGRIVQSRPERFAVTGGALTTAGGVTCYGTLDGWLRCVDSRDIRRDLFSHRMPSGVVGNVFTYEHKGRQYLGVYAGVGAWAGLAVARGAEPGSDPLGVAAAFGALPQYTEPGGSVMVFTLP